LWLSWFVAVMVCGRHGLWPSWFVAVMVCGRHGLWPSWLLFMVVTLCGHHCRTLITPLRPYTSSQVWDYLNLYYHLLTFFTFTCTDD